MIRTVSVSSHRSACHVTCPSGGFAQAEPLAAVTTPLAQPQGCHSCGAAGGLPGLQRVALAA